MMNLDTFAANEIGISLNNFIYNSISIFKYDTHELSEYIKNKCEENPLIYIDEEKIPLAVISSAAESSPGILSELFTHLDRKSTRLNSSHVAISYAVFCLKNRNES